MLKKIFLFFTIHVLCIFVVIAEQKELDTQTSDCDGIPTYLKEKRKNERPFIDAFVAQASGEEKSLQTISNALIEEVQKNVYSQKVELCYAPRFVYFATWLTRLFSWDSSPASKLEGEIKKLDDWQEAKNKEIKEIASRYEHFIQESQNITHEASKKLNKTFLDKRSNFKEIGRETERGVELLHEPNVKHLVKQTDIIQEKILPKIIRRYHNHEIPITQEELVHILSSNLVYMQRKSDLDNILKSINTIVEQHEEKQKNSPQ